MRGAGVDPIRCGRPGRAGGAPGWRRGNCSRNGRAPVESLQPPLSGRHAGVRVVCWRYRFGSGKQPFYAGYGRILSRICQFGPDPLPVVRAQSDACHRSASSLLNRCAMFNRYCASNLPVADRRSRNTKPSCKRQTPACKPRSRVQQMFRSLIDCGFHIHARL